MTGVLNRLLLKWCVNLLQPEYTKCIIILRSIYSVFQIVESGEEGV